MRDEVFAYDTLVRALNVLPDGVAIYDSHLRPLFANKVTMDRFRTFMEQIGAGRPFREVQSESIRRMLPNASEEEIRAINDAHYSYTLSGEPYTCPTENGRIVQIRFADMGNGMLAAISVDITEHRKREAELERARKAALAASEAKSAFLANMSHEIRTPLNGVLGMAQVLQATTLDPMQRECLTTLIESSSVLTAVLNDVLDLSKIEAGRLEIAPVETDLADLLRRTYRLWRPRAEEKGLEFTLAFDADLPSHLVFDGARVQQCLSNLVSNALKFTEHGRVDISALAKLGAAPGEHTIEIRVADTGPGMSADTLGRLFKPFVQADETISRRHGGTGLGLSITRRLAELMGGDAIAESELGRGSVFQLTFTAKTPETRAAALAPTEAIAATEARAALKTRQLRVLLVDDQPINRQVVRLFLRPLDMVVREACNGQEALDWLARETFDLVLLDMHMPVMDGPTTIRHIRGDARPWAKIPVIALTADAMSGDRERYLAMGMNGYIPKPLQEADLIAEISRLAPPAPAPDLAPNLAPKLAKAS